MGKTTQVRLVKNFNFPKHLMHRLIDRFDHIIAFALYWSMGGDEAITCAIRLDGTIVIGDTDWMAYLELERLNPIMERAKLGSSDTEAEEYLAFFREECYIIPVGLWDKLRSRIIRERVKGEGEVMRVVAKFFAELRKKAKVLRQVFG